MSSHAVYALTVALAVFCTVVDGQNGQFTIKTGRTVNPGQYGPPTLRYNSQRSDVFDVNNDDCVCVDTVNGSGQGYKYFTVMAGAIQNGDFWSVAHNGRDCNIFFYSFACNTGYHLPVESYGPGEIPTGQGEGITGLTHIATPNDAGFKSYEVCCFGGDDVPQQNPPALLLDIDLLAVGAIQQAKANINALNRNAFAFNLGRVGSGGRRLLQDSTIDVTQLQYSNRCCRACTHCVLLLALAVCLSRAHPVLLHPPQRPDRSSAC